MKENLDMELMAGPICAICKVRACRSEPGAKIYPSLCPMVTEQTLLENAAKTYFDGSKVELLTRASAATVAATTESGFRWTRVEDTMDFARRIGAQTLGIAHCSALNHEARLAREIFAGNGFDVRTVACSVGSMPATDFGVGEQAERLRPGQYVVMCNPIAQAAVLEQAGTQLNIVMGLCVGHDSLFFMHSHVPVTVLMAKDRALGHNPAAALYTSHSYFRRLRTG